MTLFKKKYGVEAQISTRECFTPGSFGGGHTGNITALISLCSTQQRRGDKHIRLASTQGPFKGHRSLNHSSPSSVISFYRGDTESRISKRNVCVRVFAILSPLFVSRVCWLDKHCSSDLYCSVISDLFCHGVVVHLFVYFSGELRKRKFKKKRDKAMYSFLRCFVWGAAELDRVERCFYWDDDNVHY